jgi:hypothetical protein
MTIELFQHIHLSLQLHLQKVNTGTNPTLIRVDVMQGMEQENQQISKLQSLLTCGVLCFLI